MEEQQSTVEQSSGTPDTSSLANSGTTVQSHNLSVSTIPPSSTFDRLLNKDFEDVNMAGSLLQVPGDSGFLLTITDSSFPVSVIQTMDLAAFVKMASAIMPSLNLTSNSILIEILKNRIGSQNSFPAQNPNSMEMEQVSTASSSLTETDTTAQSQTLRMPTMSTNDSVAPNSISDHLPIKDANMSGSLSQVPEASGRSITHIDSALNHETSASQASLLGHSGSASNLSIPSTCQDSSDEPEISRVGSSPDIFVEKVIQKKRFNTWCLDHETGREAWICDEVVHWFLCNLVNERYDFVEPCLWEKYKSQGIRNIQRKLIPSKTYLFPVCEDNHWILITFDSSSMWYGDSLGSEPHGKVETFMNEMNRNRRYFEHPVPTQRDAVNCGVHICLMAQSIVNKRFWYDEKDVQEFRRDTKALLKAQGYILFSKPHRSGSRGQASQEVTVVDSSALEKSILQIEQMTPLHSKIET
ncbi:hypothetical protein B9Z55_027423 [Caenorhabditis nigoni]|uniref:Ubiquitin-like protease family profile domain-containing protein n=1 Tax=Caenorhabditis nigoni TaxID=1611254 RepID=A0A2G5SFJ2_9PELO|nr:hypothetical protein B9Z55_027423 [Caenorhabditis nigoni]